MADEARAAGRHGGDPARAAGRNAAEAVAEEYYDSRDADAFYARVWGGEDIHIGLYEPADLSISQASRRTVARMAAELEGLPAGSRVVDLGAGYGGAARWLAARHGCHVTCVNLSEVQNERNRRLTAEAGLGDRIEVRHGSFEAIPAEDASFDVAWSQDAFLHAADRRRVLREVHRVLRPGGGLVFTDPMQADDCPPEVLRPVYERLHLDSLGSFDSYRKAAAEIGFEEVRCVRLTPHLRMHYARVRRSLEERYDALANEASRPYLDRMLAGLRHWVEAADRGHLAWGILHFRRC